MIQKQVICAFVLSPVLVIIPIVELCFLIRDKRLGGVLLLLSKSWPALLLMSLPMLIVFPKFEIFLLCLGAFLAAGLFGSWGRRMIDLGHFGDTSEFADLV